MKTPFIVGLICALLLWVGCKEKEIPEETMGDPVFWLEGSFDGSQERLTAGENGYYMFTDHSLDNQDRYLFEGTLADANCQTCPKNLRIRFRSSDVSVPGVDPDVEEILHLGEFPYLISEALDQFRVGFSSFSRGDGALDIKWDFGDGTTSSEINPTHVFTHSRNVDNQQAKSFDVTLKVKDVSGCEDEFVNEIIPDDSRCWSRFSVSDTARDAFLLEAFARGEPPFKYVWSFKFGNETFTSDQLADRFYEWPLREGFPDAICLTVIDEEECENTTCINLKRPDRDCLANYVYEKQGRVFSNPGETEVVIGWTDENGVRFRSDRNKQPGSSYFEVLSSEPYDDNEDGEKTRRLKVRFGCELYDENDNVFQMKGFEGFIAVAHP